MTVIDNKFSKKAIILSTAEKNISLSIVMNDNTDTLSEMFKRKYIVSIFKKALRKESILVQSQGAAKNLHQNKVLHKNSRLNIIFVRTGINRFHKANHLECCLQS